MMYSQAIIHNSTNRFAVIPQTSYDLIRMMEMIQIGDSFTITDPDSEIIQKMMSSRKGRKGKITLEMHERSEVTKSITFIKES